MISSPGCQCLIGGASSLIRTRFWTVSHPGALRSCCWRSVRSSPGTCCGAASAISTSSIRFVESMRMAAPWQPDDDLVTQRVELPGGALRLLQPRESAELPDDGAVEWAPIAPYWSVLWRSGVALPRQLDGEAPGGRSAREPGCGLAVPSIAAARVGAEVLATDGCPDALELVIRNAEANAARVDTATIDWAAPDALVARAPFDLVLAADVLYERAAVAPLLSLL